MVTTYEEAKKALGYAHSDIAGKLAICMFYHPQTTADQLVQIANDIPEKDTRQTIDYFVKSGIAVEIPRQLKVGTEFIEKITYQLAKEYNRNFSEQFHLYLDRKPQPQH
jgi:hypothetical protein